MLGEISKGKNIQKIMTNSPQNTFENSLKYL